jgi:hypothetical protein
VREAHARRAEAREAAPQEPRARAARAPGFPAAQAGAAPRARPTPAPAAASASPRQAQPAHAPSYAAEEAPAFAAEEALSYAAKEAPSPAAEEALSLEDLALLSPHAPEERGGPPPWGGTASDAGAPTALARQEAAEADWLWAEGIVTLEGGGAPAAGAGAPLDFEALLPGVADGGLLAVRRCAVDLCRGLAIAERQEQGDPGGHRALAVLARHLQVDRPIAPRAVRSLPAEHIPHDF